MPSITRSVIAVMVCLDTSAPYTSARCAAICPCVSPFADSEITRSSTPVSRRCRVVLFIAQVIIELAFQRFEHHLGQPAQQPALAGQLQPAGAGTLGQLPQQLLIGSRNRAALAG